MARRILITAALPYANGPLHIGHPRSTYLPADIYARYCRLRGYDSVFVCATDEHGTPIEVKAQQEGKLPEEFVKTYRKRHLEDFNALGIAFDNFYYTHSDESARLAVEFFKAAQEKGHVFKKTVEQTFCEKCGRFLPDRFVKGECPFCGTPGQYGDACEKCGKAYHSGQLNNPACTICRSKPVRREVEHYFFKLSAFKDFLKKYFAETKGLPQDVLNYLKTWLEDLQDWDITRDGPYFGVKIPGEENKFFYVWWDAPIGYISSTVNWAQREGKSWEAYWKNKEAELVHFIGKDIVYHHFLFWPAMLSDAGCQLPARIPTRGYLNVEAEKMSKSRGIFILLKEFLEKYEPDFLRYHLTAITPNSVSDGNFAWKEFQTKVNSELIDCYANFVFRVLSFINSKFDSTIPEPAGFSERDTEFKRLTEALAGEVEIDYEAMEFKAALEKTMAFAKECNRYFNDRAPWKLVKETGKTSEARTVLYLSAKAILALAAASEPILPFTAKKILAQLGIAKAKWGDSSHLRPGQKIAVPEILYEKIEDEQIDDELAKITPKEKPA
ncbi:MAG: methionine--tRNA ligase [Candidatus Micrarchaeota archaeon]|nr:methionine--tRNA ligase [Candidatus Micrarchaeota archaeon]